MVQEEERLQSLYDLGLLDTSSEEEFDELVHLASELCSTPMSLITLVDRERQWFKAAVGTGVRETPRDVSFCSHAIRQPDLFIVEDATGDPRFSENPHVTGEMGIRFYAGVPFRAPGGAPLGTLCVVDSRPRTLTARQQWALKILARQVQTRVLLRAEQIRLKRTAEELRHSQALFTAFMDHCPALAYVKAADGRYVYYNEKVSESFGISRAEWLGKSDEDLFPRELAESYREHDLAVLQNGARELIEETRDPSGKARHWKSHKFPFQHVDGQLMLAGISVDISAELAIKASLEHALQTAAEQAKGLEASRAALVALMDRSPCHTYLKSAAGRYLYYNQKFAAHFGIELEEWIGKTEDEVRPADLAMQTRHHEDLARESDVSREVVEDLFDASGESITLRSCRFPIAIGDGSKLLACLSSDITPERRLERAFLRANQRLSTLETVDVVTGIANRREFCRRLEVEFALANRDKRPLTLLLMDLDHSNRHVDKPDIQAREKALRGFGKILSRQVRAGDLAARLAGEEFAFLLPGTDVEGAKTFASRITNELQAAEGTELGTTANFGIAAVREDTLSYDHLLAKADQALHRAMSGGKGKTTVFE